MMPKKLNSIQFLRGIAASLVVYSHVIDVQEKFSISKQGAFFYWGNFGAIGADLFFVISGFIISYIANEYIGLTKAKEFLIKRFLRINPIYYLASLIQLIVFYYYYTPFPLEEMINKLCDTVILFPLFDSSHPISPILSVGWTLSFEWWFYLIFLGTILFKLEKKLLCLILIFGALIISGVCFRHNDLRIFFFTSPIMIEFVLGIIIYQIYHKFKISASISYLLIILGIISYLFNIFNGYGNISEFGNILLHGQGFLRVIIWGIPSAFLVAGCVYLETNNGLNKLWNSRLFLLVGDASYAIYLLHIPVLYVIIILHYKAGLNFYPDLGVIIFFIIAIFSGILFYLLIEKKIMYWFNLKV
ncbi:acyltransferase [Chitinophaga sp.]|uniref:acyltransferase family protein n=1 Tax=Chitinophaga sp. TaxID=1869181 RepID=UPI0031E13AA1